MLYWSNSTVFNDLKLSLPAWSPTTIIGVFLFIRISVLRLFSSVIFSAVGLKTTASAFLFISCFMTSISSDMLFRFSLLIITTSTPYSEAAIFMPYLNAALWLSSTSAITTAIRSGFSLSLLYAIKPIPITSSTPSSSSVMMKFLLFLLIFVHLFFTVTLTPPIQQGNCTCFMLYDAPQIEVCFPLNRQLPGF